MIGALAMLLGCAPKVPASGSVGPVAPLQIDRDALVGGTLRVFHTATVGMKDGQAFAGGGRADRRAPVSSVLFVHPVHGAVLIDAGFGRATAADPPVYPSKFTSNLLDIQEVRPMVDALADVGLAAGDIRQVFVTHLHHDHAGGIADLPGAVVRADGAEWSAAQKHKSMSGYEPEPYLGHAFAPVVFDGGAVGPIPRSHDVFGDGSLVALPAPGHTRGHTMYLVNLASGSWLFTGDSAWVDANWIGDSPVPKGWLARSLVEDDWKRGVEALYAIQWFAQQDGVTVVSGHEPANLERLRWPDPL
jgi:N-acyl homoserine lactone hydrolase